MSVDLKWLIGTRVSRIDKLDYSWFFVFDDGSSISTESFWRLLKERVILTSEDHGQMFGLPSPVDAAQVLRDKISGQAVDRSELDARSGDLSLAFSNGVVLQFVTTSSGYEGWRIEHLNRSTICLGGGDIAIVDQRMQ